MTLHILYVGIGGVIGCIARFLVVSFMADLVSRGIPLGTLLVNVVGSVVIGVGAGLAERHEWMRQEWTIFIAAGFCGGFTTFSAFALENFQFLLEKNYLAFGLYSLFSVVLCIAAVAFGFMLATR